MPPSAFIPVAEETGLIVPIGEWVLRKACGQLRDWQSSGEKTAALTMSVNLSGVQLTQPLLCETIQAILGETEIQPAQLKLEVTESVFLANAEQARAMLNRLRALGVQVQIDDFGTGYSSLAYLQNFPIQAIKIDRSFVARMEDTAAGNGTGSDLVRTIVALAHDLGVDAVAEGIETAEQLAQLTSLGCGFGQGYLLARPLDAEAAGALLQPETAIAWTTSEHRASTALVFDSRKIRALPGDERL